MQQNKTKIFTDIGALNTVSKDEFFDSDKVWNKLEHKLSKKKSKKTYWIWLAASMIILICIPALFKINKQTKNIVAAKIVLPPKIEVGNTNKQVVVSKNILKKEAAKRIEKQQIFAPDTLQNIVKYLEPTQIDTVLNILKSENKTVITKTVTKPIRKKLKVVYVGDLYEENNLQAAQQELAKEQPRKSFFKLFESQNKEPEETTTTENQPQPNRTFLGFKAKPIATISINENQ